MFRAFAAIAMLAVMFIPPASANEYGTKDEAVAMVKRVKAMFSKDGPTRPSEPFPTNLSPTFTTATFTRLSTT